jgi:hypothetical protein
MIGWQPDGFEYTPKGRANTILTREELTKEGLGRCYMCNRIFKPGSDITDYDGCRGWD